MPAMVAEHCCMPSLPTSKRRARYRASMETRMARQPSAVGAGHRCGGGTWRLRDAQAHLPQPLSTRGYVSEEPYALYRGLGQIPVALTVFRNGLRAGKRGNGGAYGNELQR